MRIIGIDPGSEESAYCVIDNRLIIDAAKLPNAEFLRWLRLLGGVDALAIEGIQSYGMVVGREIFDTCYIIGQVKEICVNLALPGHVYNRPEYARAICGVGKVTDAILYTSLKTRFGGVKKGEPLNALTGCSDLRSAFAVAVHHADLSAHGMVQK